MEIKFAFFGNQVLFQRIKLAFQRIKFLFQRIKIAFKRIKFYSTESSFYTKNQVVVISLMISIVHGMIGQCSLFTWREGDPSTGKNLQADHPSAICFLYSVSMQNVVLGPSARIFLAERWENPSARKLTFVRRVLVIGTRGLTSF